MDKTTFNRLADDCEAAILARLRDYGAAPGYGAGLDTRDRALLEALLEGYTGAPVDDADPAGVGP